MTVAPVKVCFTCKIPKPTTLFHWDLKSKDGLHSYCKACVRVRDRLRANKPVSATSKICFTCKAPKLAACFHKNPRNTDGLQSACKLCKREANFRRLLVQYNLTIEQWDEMVLNQGGMCAICDQDAVLVVDHDHATGKVRQLLCNGCNAALGFLKDSPDRATKAAEYLKKHKTP